MTKKADRRQIRTNQLLRRTLFELMGEKNISAITVTDIANRANINRGTFYLHYRDVPDMLDKIKEEVLQKIENIVIHIDPRDSRDYAVKGEPYPASEQIFEELIRHAAFFRAIVGPNGDISFVRQFREFMKEHMFAKHAFRMPAGENQIIPSDYLIAYMTSANIGLVIHWIESGMNKSAREMAIMMTQLLNYGPLITSGIIPKS
ncbi:TetR/AcrR family transcriptional regulator [Paenibacillus lautus]|uniref:TetR/AcrR family transcriptional regulator n=1 Tax=Paenibacillus lautus TaxID=1401 RepID=UPI002DB5D5EB|nr:TetR/AcrR family transcriptional regulator [Paenibacillus lautus]MEC0307796.1 TetR/AcrR family transcriptional regulator [Paenibacillus lautus]